MYYEKICEQKEKLNSSKETTIQIFLGWKYFDKIQEVYYETLFGVTSIANFCGWLKNFA